MDDEGVGGGDLGHDVEAGGAGERNEGEGEGDRPDDPGEALEAELNRRHFGAAPPAYRHTRNPSPEVSRTDLAACVCQYAWMSSEQLRAIPKQIDPKFVSTSEMTENEMKILYDSWLHLRRDKLTCGSVWFMSFFRKYPELQHLFSHFGDCPIEMLPFNEHFLDRVQKVMDYIDRIMGLLKRPSACNKEIFKAGLHHVRQVNLEQFKCFQETTVPQILSACFGIIHDLNYLQKVWNKFFAIMFGIMADAALTHDKGYR